MTTLILLFIPSRALNPQPYRPAPETGATVRAQATGDVRLPPQTIITKRQVNALLDLGFIYERQNLVFIGPPGVGKTHLAIGIALKTIDAGAIVKSGVRPLYRDPVVDLALPHSVSLVVQLAISPKPNSEWAV